MSEVVFLRDRADGGRILAQALAHYRDVPCVVYGLPRGGVITAREVADALQAPLEILVTRKLRHPDQPEFAIGSVTDAGEVLLNERIAATLPAGYLADEEALRIQEARDRKERYAGDHAPVPVEGKTAILVDDGIATGFTMKAAILAVRSRHPAKVVVAAPVAAREVVEEFRQLADEVVVPFTPTHFYAIGTHYAEFSAVGDEEVAAALKEHLRT